MQRAPYFPQLDGLRAIAILLVVVGHELLATRLHDLGGLGVLLFFVLSGFLITSLLLREEASTGGVNMSAFYMRRALRIVPAMLFFVAAIAVLSALGAITDVPRHEFAVCLLYLRNIFGRSETLGHLWSLSLEEQFYLLWPLTMLLLRGRARLWVAALLVAIGCVWRGIAIWRHLFDYNLGIVYERTDLRFDSIMSGCVLALGLSRHGAALRRWLAWWPAGTDLALFVMLIGSTVVGKPTWFMPFELTLQTILAALLLARLVTVEASAAGRLLAMPALRWLGRLSYSWYLWQQPFVVTRSTSWGIFHVRPLDALFSLVLAACSYYVVEMPFLRMKTRFAARPSGGTFNALSTSSAKSI